MQTSEIGYRVARYGDRALNDGLLWRTEAASRRSAGVGDRPALHEVLFCQRAGLVDGIRVPRWEDLGDPITQELVRDEVRAHHGRLVVAGDVIELDDPLPGTGQDTHDLVQATCAVLRILLPRQQGENGHLDIGHGFGKNEVTRLAHKLHDGFQLPLSQTAQFLDQAGYIGFSGNDEKNYNKQRVYRLLKNAWLDDDPPWSVDGESIRSGRRDVLPHIELMAVYEPDGGQINAARLRECQEVAKRHQYHMAYLLHPGTQSGGLATLFNQVSTPLPIKSLYVTDPSVFTDEFERQVTYAWVEHFGIQVLEAGNPVLTCGEGGKVVQEIVKTYAALRAHDRYTILESTRSIAHARMVANRLKAEGGYSYEAIARRLEVEAIPTRKRRGTWSKSAVSRLLTEGAS